MAARLRDSITDLDPGDSGAVVVSGSHGGLYPAALAARAGLRGVIFNDAGGGLARAGVAGVLALADVGMAAAAVGCASARIGDAADMMAEGVISVANAVAAALGVAPGMAAAEAAALMEGAAPPRSATPMPAEARREARPPAGPPVLLVDSASLVRPGDAGRVIVTGSHGGLIGGDPARALKAAARLAVFNDAGIGKDRVGLGRLPALAARGVAAVTVGHDTARIGDAASALETGVVSAANGPAAALGLRAGQRLSRAIRDLADDGGA